MANETPLCPECGAPARRKLVRHGRRAGLDMWGCIRYPDCKGAINIDPPQAGPSPNEAAPPRAPALPAAYAQRRHERELARSRMRRRAALPLLVAVTMMAMAVGYASMQPFGTAVASLVAVAIGVILAILFFRMPFESLIWTRGVEGERKTAEYLAPLLDDGYIVLYNRLIPGLGGDVDSVVIGPTGIFPIETKNWNGNLDVRNGRLFLGESERTWAVDQLYREALAVQIALGQELNNQRVTVTPVLCAVGGVKASQRVVKGIHVTNGKGLARFIQERPRVFDDDTVRRIARLAERQLREQYVWEVESAR